MSTLKEIVSLQIICGGMGVWVSNYLLARAVARAGGFAVVSGTALAHVYAVLFGRGDQDALRAAKAFPNPDLVRRVLARYANREETAPVPLWNGVRDDALWELTMLANFCEVFLAKEGHNAPVGINYLDKVGYAHPASVLGALLAGIDVIIVGAGIPLKFPKLIEDLASGRPGSYAIPVEGGAPGQKMSVTIDPRAFAPDVHYPLTLPYFFPIVASNPLASILIRELGSAAAGLIVECVKNKDEGHYTLAGGHDAPPRGPNKLDESGQLIYGPKDEVDMRKIADLGIPYWRAGGQTSPQALAEVLEAGGKGVQVGTSLSWAKESGLRPDITALLRRWAFQGNLVIRQEPDFSATGFPFMVGGLPGTVADEDVYAGRDRRCEIGCLRSVYARDGGKIGFRCSAEPILKFVRKGGKLEDALRTRCLCDGLSAAVGLAKPGTPPIVTAGSDTDFVRNLMQDPYDTYTAADVIGYIQGKTRPAT